MFKKKSLTTKDLSFLLQYMTIHFSEVLHYRTFLLMFNQKRDDLFDHIHNIDKNYLKKSNLIFITENTENNNALFDTKTMKLLESNITRESLEFLSIVIKNGSLSESINSKLWGEMIKTAVMSAIGVIILGGTLYSFGGMWFGMAKDGGALMQKADLSLLTFCYDNLYLILFFSLFGFFLPLFWLFGKHFFFYTYDFSKLYIVLKYKELLYSMLFNKYDVSRNNKDVGTVLYFNLKEEYQSIINGLYPFILRGEFLELQFFVENPNMYPNISNNYLKNDIIDDYKKLLDFQNMRDNEKRDFFNNVKSTINSYQSVLSMNFEKDYKKIESITGVIQIFSTMYIIIVVMIILMPIINSIT